MNGEVFFQKFELVADAPDAVAKMRDLVLELAVQGRLVEQKAGEGDGHALLELIHKKNSPSGIVTDAESLDDKLPTFPNNWAASKLGEVAEIVRGVSFPGSAKSETRFDGDVACLRTASVQAEIDWDDLIYISPSHVSRSEQWVAPNDIMISMANSYALVGKVAIVREVPQKATFGAFLAAIRPVLIDPYFLLYVLRSPRMQEAFRASSSQTTNIANISLVRMRPLPFPLPPLAEQRRIVAKVDELMALCDQLEALQQERETRKSVLVRASLARFAETPTPANLGFLFYKSYDVPPAELRKTILTLAVQGKLVPQDSADESVDELLVRSHEERRKLNRTVVAAARHLRENEGLGYRIPTSWRWQLLDELLVFGPTNGFSPRAVDYETPTRSLTLSATTSGRFKGEYSKFIAAEVPHDSDLWLRDGDILIQRGNTSDYVGVAAVYRGEPNRFVYPDLMMKVRVSSCFDVAFIHLAMSEDAARNFLRRRATGTSSNMPKINQTTLRCLPLPVPPHSEQCRIVAKVDQLMSLVDELERQQELSRTTASRLLDAIVHELTGDR